MSGERKRGLRTRASTDAERQMVIDALKAAGPFDIARAISDILSRRAQIEAEVGRDRDED